MVPKISIFFPLISFFLLVSPSYQSVQEKLRECINNDKILYFPWNASHEPILESTIQNLRLLHYSNRKPMAIVTPLAESDVQKAVLCSKESRLKVRVRTGGHDYEGMSYTSFKTAPFFVLVDLVHLSSVYDVDTTSKTVWVQSGATLGQLYYWINENTEDYSFAGGICPTVGVGGLITGGGIGYMTRKHGLASDNVVDARIVDVNGQILNREAMEKVQKDLFWAIAGGGAASFGIVTAWKLQLVSIPQTVTVFNLSRSLDEGGLEVLEKAQTACYSMNRNLRMRVEISTTDKTRPATVKFSSVFLGEADKLVQAMEESFPELGLKRGEYQEMSWINAITHFYYPGEPKEVLRDRKPLKKYHFKAKSDFVTEPLTRDVLQNIWDWCSQKPEFRLIMHFFGGRMDEIQEDESPFPFRKGYLYDSEYSIQWQENDAETATKNIKWVRGLHEYMAPFVSKNPRGAFSNFRDYDLGVNKFDGSTYEEARRWGEMYFKNNFKRLAIVKGKVDLQNYFSLEQTVPPLIEEESFSASVAAVSSL